MTLQELDDALRKFGLNLDVKEGAAIRDRIISNYGKTLVAAKKFRCERCEQNGFGKRFCNSCEFNNQSIDPLIVGKSYINSPNNIDLVPFIVQYVIPVYEEVSGDKNVINQVRDEIRKRLRTSKTRQEYY